MSEQTQPGLQHSCNDLPGVQSFLQTRFDSAAEVDSDPLMKFCFGVSAVLTSESVEVTLSGEQPSPERYLPYLSIILINDGFIHAKQYFCSIFS